MPVENLGSLPPDDEVYTGKVAHVVMGKKKETETKEESPKPAEETK